MANKEENQTPEMPKIGAGKTLKNVPLASIIADVSKMQAREKISAAKVKEYAKLMAEGIKFPPIEVFSDGGEEYTLADGFHRLHAMMQNGDVSCAVKVFTGGEDEALFYSLGANSSHGLTRSNNDKKKAVHTFLTHPEFSLYSDRDIGKHLGVSNVMVSKYRKTLKKQAGEEPAESGKGSKGGRLRVELQEHEQDLLDDALSEVRNKIVACAKLFKKQDEDFLKRLFSAELKLLIKEVSMGETVGRKLHPNNVKNADAGA